MRPSEYMSDAIDRLIAVFERFPGIGPRQAQRFVQFLLRGSPSLRRELVDAIQSLGGTVRQCAQCLRYHSNDKKICSLCADPERDVRLLAVVASDVDVAALERGGVYRGRYFVLGGTISLASEKTNGLRVTQLLDSIPARVEAGLSEIILAFPANTEGDFTASYVREQLTLIDQNQAIRITSLGRGLSTGSELEYADPETIKNALEGRR